MEQQPIVPTDNIPVEITIRIGRCRMTVAELSAVKENDILPLAQSVSDEVEVCVGDHVIAYGELVDGDSGPESLMLRITHAAQRKP